MSFIDDLGDALDEIDALRKARDRYGLTVAVHDTLAPALRDAVLEATEELTTRKIEALARRVYLSLGGGE
jgi:hypothetical protein